MENGFVVFMKLSPYLSSQDWFAQRELPLAPFPSVWMASVHLFRLGEAWLEADFFVTLMTSLLRAAFLSTELSSNLGGEGLGA